MDEVMSYAVVGESGGEGWYSRYASESEMYELRYCPLYGMLSEWPSVTSEQ